MLDPVALGKNLASLREKTGMNPKQLAQQLQMESENIVSWENGKSYPETLLLPDLANIFKVSIDTLLGLQTIPAEPEEVWPIDLDDASADYAIILTENNKAVRFHPQYKWNRLTIQLIGNCHDFSTNCNTVIHGDVQGNAHFSSDAPVYVDGGIQGEVTALCELTIHGDVFGEVGCGTVRIYGNASDIVSCSNCMVEGNVTGNLESNICDVTGEIKCENVSCGSIKCEHIECGSLLIKGPVSGKIDLFDGIFYES